MEAIEVKKLKRNDLFKFSKNAGLYSFETYKPETDKLKCVDTFGISYEFDLLGNDNIYLFSRAESVSH